MSGAAPVIVIGAGGHARVVADALLASGRTVLGFTDVDAARHGQTLLGLPVLGGDEALAGWSPNAVELANGLGTVTVPAPGLALPRQRVQQQLAAAGWRFVTVRHPSAVVSPFAGLATGVQVMAGAVVQAGARVGEGSLVNTGALIDHDVQVGAYCHVAPGAVVCGDVCIGAGCHIGAGAVLRQGVALGDQVLVGAGAVVLKAVAGPAVVAGVPARALSALTKEVR